MRRNLYNEIAETRTQELEMFDAEKERILQRVRKEKKPRRRLAAVLKTAGAVAACFALLVTASVFSPVLAENIPFMENIVAFLKQSGQARSSVIADGAVGDYVTPVAGQEDANFRVTEVYCDGNALVLGVAADVENVDEHVRVLGPKYTLKINGDTVNTLGDGTAPDSYLYPISENTFAGVFVMNLRELNLTEAFEIELSAELIGIDTQHMVLENGGSSYTPKTYALPETYAPVTMTVEPDQTLQKTYEIKWSGRPAASAPSFIHRIYMSYSFGVRSKSSGSSVSRFCCVRAETSPAVRRRDWLRIASSTRFRAMRPLPAVRASAA